MFKHASVFTESQEDRSEKKVSFTLHFANAARATTTAATAEAILFDALVCYSKTVTRRFFARVSPLSLLRYRNDNIVCSSRMHAIGGELRNFDCREPVYDDLDLRATERTYGK